MTTDLSKIIPGQFLDGPDPEMDVISDEHPPRLLISHGKNEGVLTPAWEKYGRLDQGDLVIQHGEEFYLCDPTDAWFLLPKQFKQFAGNRNGFTKELLEASLDPKDGARGCDMTSQVMGNLLWIPSTVGRKLEDGKMEVPPTGMAVHFQLQKATASPWGRFIKAIRVAAKEESDQPAALRRFGLLIGGSRDCRSPDPKTGEIFSYATLSLKIRKSDPDTLARCAVFLESETAVDQIETVSDRIARDWDEVVRLAEGDESGEVFGA